MTKSVRKLQLPILGLLLLGTLPVIASVESWPYGVLLVIGAAASWRVGMRPDRSRWTERTIHVAAIASLLWVVAEWYWLHVPVILSIAHFLILVAICKMFERRTARDLALLILVAIMLLLVAAIVSAELVFPVSLAGFLMLGPCAAIRLHIQLEHDRALALRNELTPGSGPSVEPDKSPPLAPLGIRIALACLIFAMASFVLSPRMSRRATPYWLAASSTLTGFNTNNDLNKSGRTIQDDDALVMRVWAWRGDRPLVAEEFQPYLRAFARERYLRFKRRGYRTFFGWRPAARSHLASIDLENGEEATDLIRGLLGTTPADELQLTVVLERRRTNYIFTPYPPLAIHSPQISNVNKELADQSISGRVGRRRSPLRYSVWSVASMTPGLLGALDRERAVVGQPKVSRDIPVGPRVREKARQIWEQAGSPELDDADGRIRTLRAIARYLRSEEFAYSLDLPKRPQDAEPVEHFLFDSRQGHCEIYATAMAVLCQTLGIQTRYVTGYIGSEFNPVAECFLIRQHDAHAWVEAFVPGRDWMTFDPSPVSLADYQETGWWDTVKDYVDYFRYHWIDMVISYDTYSRAELLAQSTSWLTGSDVRHPAGIVPRAGSWLKDLIYGPTGLNWGPRLFYWSVVALSAGLAVAIFQLLYRLAVWAGRRLPRRQKPGPGLQYYQRLLRVLGAEGFSPARGQTPREFVLAVADHRRALQPATRAVEFYYALRFGQREPDAEEIGRMNRLLRELQLAARRSG